jgi:TetR/AcrR family transcriptional regulator, regulator of cefoperazone and chloramphenicol sensitivity
MKSVTKTSRSTRPRTRVRPERGDATQQKLLTAAIDVFGRLGFDGTSTRALADAAGVNLQAIPYYFGDKQGLYIAAAEQIATLIQSHVSGLRERVRARLDVAESEATPLDAGEARGLLTEIAQAMAALFVSDESEAWARFVIREQMEPTEAFNRLYGGVMKPMMEVAGRLMAVILGEPPGTEHIRLRVISLLGSIMVFRIARAAVMAQLGWNGVGPREADVVRKHAAELIAAIGRQEASR